MSRVALAAAAERCGGALFVVRREVTVGNEGDADGKPEQSVEEEAHERREGTSRDVEAIQIAHPAHAHEKDHGANEGQLREPRLRPADPAAHADRQHAPADEDEVHVKAESVRILDICQNHAAQEQGTDSVEERANSEVEHGKLQDDFRETHGGITSEYRNVTTYHSIFY